MPRRDDLQHQLANLRAQLEQNPPLDDDERQHLHTLAAQIEEQLTLENSTHTQSASLADGVNLAVERFEVKHPTIAGTLRNIVQTLGNIGI